MKTLYNLYQNYLVVEEPKFVSGLWMTAQAGNGTQVEEVDIKYAGHLNFYLINPSNYIYDAEIKLDLCGVLATKKVKTSNRKHCFIPIPPELFSDRNPRHGDVAFVEIILDLGSNKIRSRESIRLIEG